jgi:hypothetical protein
MTERVKLDRLRRQVLSNQEAAALADELQSYRIADDARAAAERDDWVLRYSVDLLDELIQDQP